jgi:hypothetical protein
MTTYAGIKQGWVIQTFTPLPEWERIAPADIFARELFDAWVPIDGLNPQPASGWKYADGAFTPPTEADAGAMRDTMVALRNQPRR